MTVNVGAIGWYGKGNVGDESYKLSLRKLFPSLTFSFGDHVVQKASGHILGGGDVVTQDSLNTLRSAHGRKTILSVSISKIHPSRLFEGIDQVFVRDHKSLDNMIESGVEARYAPDLAFCLQGDADRGKSWLRHSFASVNHELYSKVVLVVLNSHLCYNPSLRQSVAFEKLALDLSHIADFTSASFVFLPFGRRVPWDDRVPAAWTASKAKFWRKNFVCYDGDMDVQGVLDIFAACDAVVSSRLHATIFAIAHGKPFVDITHNHKNAALLEAVELTDFSVPFITFDAHKCLSILRCSLENPDRATRVGDIGKHQFAILEQQTKDLCLV